MKILVTGGAGFIGSEFVRQAIKTGYETIVVDALTYAGDIEKLKNAMSNEKFCKELGIEILDWKEALRHFIIEKTNLGR